MLTVISVTFLGRIIFHFLVLVGAIEAAATDFRDALVLCAFTSRPTCC